MRPTTTVNERFPVMAMISRLNEARAILNESPSATPGGSMGNQNENGVTVNIVGIGIGFVGGALSLIALTLITKLLIARRRARENGTPRPQLWDIVFDGGTSQGRLAIGRSLGGWDYGMDIWSTRDGTGLWGLAGVAAGDKGEVLGEKPRLVEVMLGKPEQVTMEMKEWQPTTTFLHWPNPIEPSDPKPTLSSSATISTAVLILLPTPESPWPLPLPRRASIRDSNNANVSVMPTDEAVIAGSGSRGDEAEKWRVQHIENTEVGYWNRVTETLGKDGQAVRSSGDDGETGLALAQPAQMTTTPDPVTSTAHHESALGDEELTNLPDFVVGVLKLVVVSEDEVVVESGQESVTPVPATTTTSKVDERTHTGETLGDRSIGGTVKGFFGR